MGTSILGMMQGLVARAAEGDLEAVEQLRRLEAYTPVLVGKAVAAARKHAGYSWAELAPALGTTRQAASERFKDVEPPSIIWTGCGRAAFTEAGRFLHERKCLDCGKRQELGA